MKKLSLAGSALILLAPFVAFAQTTPFSNITQLVLQLGNIVRLFIPLLIALAIVVFFWGLVKYIRGQGKDHAEGRNTMIAGLVSLFIMVTLYGVLHFAADALGVQYFNTNVPLQSPRVQ